MGLSTACYTVDGEIIGESSNGTRLDYLTDALGSVTAKVDQTASVVSTARYKPYGEILSGSLYKFAWVGALGYRNQGMQDAEFYVKTRHYSSISGSWGSQDYYWPIQPSFCYAHGSVTLLTDPTGLASVRKHFHEKTDPTKCGNGSSVLWTLNVTPKKGGVNGWLVQRVSWDWTIKTCRGFPIDGPFDCMPQYYEVWKVLNGIILSKINFSDKWDNLGQAGDVFRLSGTGDSCNYALNWKQKGALQFFEMRDPTDEWLVLHGIDPTGATHVSCAGKGHPSSNSFLTDDFTAADDSFLLLDWACCYAPVICPTTTQPCCKDPLQPGQCYDTVMDYEPKD